MRMPRNSNALSMSVLLLMVFQVSCSGGVPSELCGVWTATGHVYGESKDIPIHIEIHPDFTVTGQVGDAVLRNCRFESNRGEFARQLNLFSDYIITGGTIEGRIYEGDYETSRSFTLPCNLKEDVLTGNIMVLRAWEYPEPILGSLIFSAKPAPR